MDIGSRFRGNDTVRALTLGFAPRTSEPAFPAMDGEIAGVNGSLTHNTNLPSFAKFFA
jgi:hypothetical protein